MAYHGYMRITGKLQGLISAGCGSQASIGNKCQVGHGDEIMVLSFNHSLSNTLNAIRSTHHPVIVTKLVDKASPLLGQAVDGREVVDCDIHFYCTHPAGHREKYFSVRLEDALIVAQDIDVPHAVLMTDQETEERLYIRYRTISWIHHAAGTSGHATWGEQS